MIEVEDHAFSTAGDYERSFVKDGKRYHHIIDPRTGYPATASRSVTIWAKDALTADAIDDAVFILGPERGLALVDSIEDCGAVIVDAENKVWISKRLSAKAQVLKAPDQWNLASARELHLAGEFAFTNPSRRISSGRFRSNTSIDNRIALGALESRDDRSPTLELPPARGACRSWVHLRVQREHHEGVLG